MSPWKSSKVHSKFGTIQSHLSRIFFPIFSISICQDNLKKEELFPGKKHLSPFTRPLGTLYFYVFSTSKNLIPFFPSKKSSWPCSGSASDVLPCVSPRQRNGSTFDLHHGKTVTVPLVEQPVGGFKESANKNSTKKFNKTWKLILGFIGFWISQNLQNLDDNREGKAQGCGFIWCTLVGYHMRWYRKFFLEWPSPIFQPFRI